jgi:PPOX class probable F420-dependent enzyme
MLDLSLEFSSLVDQRLREAEIIWLTTVTPAGAPQPNPVWFYWDGEYILIYSQPTAYRIRNLKHNPVVALHLEGADTLGHNVIILTGEAVLNPEYPTPHPGYVQKYERYLPAMHTTMEELSASFSVEIRIKPLKIRGE